ncbi:Retrotransposon nucleocapsid protein, related [Eimeria mitis]|uniref:Retrotransposon nucleocapsid protein, related n=1 Tax=Eimeria mitis TaxID=44415 RepID=U6JV62_9EIME|nr:Retrotransposon nucleocapsid protein, related [Eimeria mitis]CDJ29330.1 Retrotransposon nucleocapsid protein, related [Eimeria mitis]
MMGEKVELADMMEYLRRMEKKNATPTALAEKEESGHGNNPDLEPMDIGAVNTKPAKHGARSGYLKGPREITAAPTDRPRVNSVLVQVTQWKVQMRSSDDAIEVTPPGSDERVHLSALPTAFASSMVRGVEIVSEEKGSDEASPPCRGTEENNGGTQALRHDGLAKTAVLRESIQLTPEEWQKLAKLKEEFSDALNSKEVPASRRPPHLEEEIERQGKVQPSTSAFGHNRVLAKKKDGRWRMCVDFKHLNKITVKQKFPMPRVDEILDRLQGSAVYSAFDFAEAFLHISIHPEDRHKTAFHSRTRNLEYTSGVEPDPAKIEAIQRWPLPLYTRTDVQKFVRLASYCRNFIPGFARIAAPLTDLLKKEKQFIWTENEDEAARRLIGHMTSSPVLALLDFDKPFFLTTDASDTAVAVMLSQQAIDTHAAAVLAKLNHGRRVKHYSTDGDILWYHTKRGVRQLYVLASLRTELLRKMHDHALAGHGGVNTTVERVARSLWWPRMRPSVEEYVLSCPDCQKQKPRNTLKPGFLHSLSIPDRIWTDISMDFILGLPPVRGHDSIYIVVDRLSKYAHFIPCSSTVTAEGVSQLFINHVWKLHGSPKSIIADRDPKFVSAFWRSLMQRLGIDHNMTTANHPEADGQTEGTNRTLVEYLRLYTQHNTSNWLDFLAFSFNPGDLVLVDSHALRSAQEGEQPKKFATRRVGPFAVRSPVNALAYIIDLPPTWRCHHTINVGFLKQLRGSPRFPRTLARKPHQRPRELPRLEETEILEVRVNARRGHRKREYYVKWPGTRDPEWVSEDRLRDAIPPEQLSALLDLASPTPSVWMQAGCGSGNGHRGGEQQRQQQRQQQQQPIKFNMTICARGRALFADGGADVT